MTAFTKPILIVLLAILLVTVLPGCNGLATPEPAIPGKPPPTEPFIENNLSSVSKIQTRGALILGTALTEPFVFHDPATDELIGFDIDLANRIASLLGVTLEVVEMPFANLIPALQDQKVDMTIAAMYITDDRNKLVDFSQPYLETGLVMAALPEQQMKIQTVQDLSGLRVGVKIGATGSKKAQELIAQGINLEIVEYKDTLDSLLDLEVGRLDIIFNDYLNTLAYIKNTQSNIKIVTNQAGEVYFLLHAGLGIAVQQNSPDLIKLINSSLDEMKQDGTLDRLYQFWLLPSSDD